MSIEDLKNRFKRYAIDVALLIKVLPQDIINLAYCRQLIRSSSSSAANYRAACRAKSMPDFINKLKIVEEELDESDFFLDMLQHFNENRAQQIDVLRDEGRQLLAITIQSIKTARNNINKTKAEAQ
jgi:four helix bundle protein